MGNGHSCAAVEDWLRNRGGLRGWIDAQAAPFVKVGAR
jgi:hypothetical protein